MRTLDPDDAPCVLEPPEPVLFDLVRGGRNVASRGSDLVRPTMAWRGITAMRWRARRRRHCPG